MSNCYIDSNKIILLIILIIFKLSSYIYLNVIKDKKFIDNFDYINYESYLITKRVKENSGWMYTSSNQYYLVNGIIRKHKPKNCLEVGVARGGSSILILNAIKDIPNSCLISLDLNTNLYFNQQYKTGFRVKKYFPELTDKWQLFTGEQPHVFLEKLNMKFDFVFLDTAHISPGEILNFIEILPFLKENAIFIIHDIVFHFTKEKGKEKIQSFSSPTLLLMSVLHGDKIILKNEDGIDNIGAIYLYKNQEKHYLDYFLLLMSFWEYIPTERQLDEIRIFIKKYYKNDQYLLIFDTSIKNNKNYVNKIKELKDK